MTSIKSYLKFKKQNSSSRTRKGLPIRPNGRSTDFVAPGLATGCELTCSYCYVARHRSIGNPLETYINQLEIFQSVYNHLNTLNKKTPNQCDPIFWTYDIGESSDCLTPKNIENTNNYLQYFEDNLDAKPSFATKVAAPKKLRKCKTQYKHRIRVSISPYNIIAITEKTTSSLKSRIKGIQILLDLGYEVHLNFSPVIAYMGWYDDYAALLQYIDCNITEEAKKQLKCEVIFLTHANVLHTKNLPFF
jgi:spore photoproduct lyase